MIYNLANILVKKMLVYNLIKNDVQEYYKYSIQIHIERFIGFSLLLFISVFCGLMYETVFFYIFFSYIRRYSGGFHANSFGGCIFCSVTIYLVYIKILYPILLRNILLNMCILVFSLFIVLIFGAANHPNMHWNMEEYVMCRNIARVVAIIEVNCIILLFVLGVSYSYILFMSFGLTLSAIMLLLAKIIRQEVS